MYTVWAAVRGARPSWAGAVGMVGLVVLLAGPQTAGAEELFFSQDNNPNGLFRLNTVTGQATLVGAGLTGVTGETVGLSQSANPSLLFGSGPFNFRQINADGSGSSGVGTTGIEGLAFDPTSGLVYGAINGQFFTVNQATGGILTNLAAPGADVEGLAWAPGFIFGLGNDDNLRRYTIATNTWALVGNTGVNFDNAGLAFDPGASVLYAVGDVGAANNLYRIDPATGLATVVGPLLLPSGVDTGGLAFVSGTAVIPEPSGIALLSLGVLSLLGYSVRRRRAARA